MLWMFSLLLGCTEDKISDTSDPILEPDSGDTEPVTNWPSGDALVPTGEIQPGSRGKVTGRALPMYA